MKVMKVRYFARPHKANDFQIRSIGLSGYGDPEGYITEDALINAMLDLGVKWSFTIEKVYGPVVEIRGEG